MEALPLADELFLFGHNQYSGRPHVHDAVLDTVLAGGVLGELALAGRLTVGDDALVVVNDQRPHGERVSDAALAEILKEHQSHSARAWVEYLRDHSRIMIAPRLIHIGLIERVQVRAMLKQSVRYKATDTLRAAGPQARLRFMLDHPANLDEQTAALGSLVLAGGMEFVLGGSSGRAVRDSLSRLRQLLKPDLQAVVAGVESAVAQITLTGRR